MTQVEHNRWQSETNCDSPGSSGVLDLPAPHHSVGHVRLRFRQQVLHFEGRQLARLVGGCAHSQLLFGQQGGGWRIQLGCVVNGLQDSRANGSSVDSCCCTCRRLA